MPIGSARTRWIRAHDDHGPRRCVTRRDRRPADAGRNADDPAATAVVTPAGPAPAVLFDVDGTLVDSNYLHVHAWYRAFDEAELSVEAWRIHRSIGMDGSDARRVTGRATPTTTPARGSRISIRATTSETASLLRPLPGARELLERGRQRSACKSFWRRRRPRTSCAILRKVLGERRLVSAVTSSNDVDTAKPKPDIVEVALDRAGVDADHARLRRRRGVGRRGLRAGRGADDRGAQRWGIPRRTRNRPVHKRFSIIPAICASTSTARRSRALAKAVRPR